MPEGKPRFTLPLYALVLLNGKVVPATPECAEAPGAWHHCGERLGDRMDLGRAAV